MVDKAYVQPDGEADGTSYYQDAQITPASLADGSLFERLDTHQYPRTGVTSPAKQGQAGVAPTAVDPAVGYTPAQGATANPAPAGEHD